MSGLIVHEWVSRFGGSENVFKALSDVFPEAELASLWVDDPERFPHRQVQESWLSRTPLRRHKSLALPLMIPTWRRFTPEQQQLDWILASSHAFAHHIRPSRYTSGVPKYVYAHTPARYIWSPDLDVRGAGPIFRAASWPLRVLDRRAAREPVSIAANSAYVQQRIEDYWHRESIVIHPPVDITPALSRREWSDDLRGDERRIADDLPPHFLLGFSRFVEYKRLDVAITAARLTGIPLVLAGAGPDEQRLREMAAVSGIDVRFIVRPSNALLFTLYSRAAALFFPGIEDFGIVPVEAMSFGTPVIANVVGGAQETVIPGTSGALIDPDDHASLVQATDMVAHLDRGEVQRSSMRFSVDRFHDEIRAWMAPAGVLV